MNPIKSLLGVSTIVPFALLILLYPTPTNALVLSPFSPAVNCIFGHAGYYDCIKQEQQQQAQKQANKTCQANLDNAGGHGVSAYGNESGFLRRAYDPVTSCTIICDIGYYPTVSNTCAPTLATMNQAITSQTVTSTQLVQQTKQSSGLTDSQVQAIVMLLQMFGADQAVVSQVQTALRGT